MERWTRFGPDVYIKRTKDRCLLQCMNVYGGLVLDLQECLRVLDLTQLKYFHWFLRPLCPNTPPLSFLLHGSLQNPLCSRSDCFGSVKKTKWPGFSNCTKRETGGDFSCSRCTMFSLSGILSSTFETITRHPSAVAYHPRRISIGTLEPRCL